MLQSNETIIPKVYCGQGSLRAISETRDENIYVILVKWNGKFVVSRYRCGEKEWFNGRYFNNLSQAMDNFNKTWEKFAP